MKAKKGAGFWLVISLIVLMVAFVYFFFPFTAEANDLIQKTGDSTACSLSLIKGTDASKCPFYEVDINSDKVEIYDDQKKEWKTVLKRDSQSNNEFANEAMARLMIKCLNNGGGYNSRAFSPESYVMEESVCLRCYTVDIDESVGNVQGFTEFLRDKKAKGSLSGKKYLEVLTKDERHLKAYMEYGAGLGLVPSSGNFVFSPGITKGEDYTIFFMGIKKGYLTRKVGWAALFDQYTASFLVGYFNIHDSYFVYISESKDLPKVCDRQIN